MYKGKLYEYEGKLLSVKTIAGMVELAPSTLYKYLNQGFSLYDAIDEGKKKSSIVFKTRAKTNNRVAKKYPYRNDFYTVEEIANLEEVSKDALYRRINSGMTVEEAVKAIKSNISKKYPFRGSMCSAYKISVISGVPKYFLLQKLDSDKEYQESDIEELLSFYKKEEILMVGDMTLFQYCIQNQYNYNAIYYSVKHKGYTIEEAIEEYVNEDRREYFHYSFVLGDILLYHFFLREKLNDRYITDRMRKGETVEDAITASIFLAGEDYATRDIRNELYRMYRALGIEQALQQDIGEEHKKYIASKHKRVLEVRKDYNLYQAISMLSSGSLSKEDRKMILETLSLTEEDLLTCREELFEGFVDRTPSIHEQNPVSYIWHGVGKKS